MFTKISSRHLQYSFYIHVDFSSKIQILFAESLKTNMKKQLLSQTVYYSHTNFPSTCMKHFWQPCPKFSPKSRGTFAKKTAKTIKNCFLFKKMLYFKIILRARNIQFWQPSQNLSQKVQKSEKYYTIIFFLKDLVSRHQNLLERWSASLTACWTNVCQISESRSPNVWKHLWKNDLIKRKLFPENFFGT